MLTLLDYGTPRPFGQIVGKARHLAWPIDAYRVTLPRRGGDGDGLNPFERVILKLLEAAGLMDAEALAEATRIPPDLVRSILLRLQDRELIDEYHQPLAPLHLSGGAAAKKTVYATALVFRELVTGKYLPFIHWLDQAFLLQKKEAEEHRFRQIRPDSALRHARLTQRDVIGVLRATKRRYAEFGLEANIPAVGQIMIVDQPERYYLDCPVAIQKSDGEFRIADPFGSGYSLLLERAFERLLEKDEGTARWLHQWKRTLSQAPGDGASPRRQQMFGRDSNAQRYPNLLASLWLPAGAVFQSRAKIYAAIEWALFYACSVRPLERVVARLRRTPATEHPALLAAAAQCLGLVLPSAGFRAVRDGKLTAFQSGAAELETLLAIAILQAQEDPSHPLHRIVARRPEWLIELLQLNMKRNEKVHGKGRADAPELELPEALLMRVTVHALLPEIVFPEMPVSEQELDFRADALLDARASIQGEFGFAAFNRLSRNLKERLVHAERFFLSCRDGDDALALVVDLYAALQATFETALAGKLAPDVDDAALVAAASERAAAAGLGGELPVSLRTVKASAVRQTLQGEGQSLGACVLAFLLLAEADSLRLIADMQPGFVADVGRIIGLRGHGNQPLPMAAEAAAVLRKTSYNTIQTLIEV